MICSICISEGKKSTVRQVEIPIPKLEIDQYWDENGDLHIHNPNASADAFQCSAGHITRPQGNACPTCKWEWEVKAGKKLSYSKQEIAEKEKAELAAAEAAEAVEASKL